jgi:hypothetical protein
MASLSERQAIEIIERETVSFRRSKGFQWLSGGFVWLHSPLELLRFSPTLRQRGIRTIFASYHEILKNGIAC